MSGMTDDSRHGIGGNMPPEPTLKERLTETYAPMIAEVDRIAEVATALPKVVGNDKDLDRVGVVVKDAKAMAKRLDGARKAEKKEFDDKGKEVQAHFNPVIERLGLIAERLEDRATAYQREKLAAERREREEAARKLREKEEAERRKAQQAEDAGRAAVAGRAEDRAEIAGQRAAELEDQAAGSAADLTRTRGASGTLATSKTTLDFRIVDIAKVNLETLRPYLDREAIEKAIRSLLRFQKGNAVCEGVEFFENVKASFR